MPAVGSPEPDPRGENCDDRIEKTPCLIDDISQPFVVSVGEISLEGRWFDRIDRQDAQQYRMTGKRFLVRSNNAAAGFGDCFCGFGCSSCRLLESAFGWAEALRPGFGFARTLPGWCTLDHGRNCILVVGGLSLLTDRGHNDGVRMPVAVVPRPLMTVAAAGRNELV
jgi:hypothetical protein